MKKGLKTYLIIWIIFFVVLNVCAFVIPSTKNTNFYVVYGTLVASFIIEIVCGYIALTYENIKKTFYNLSLIQISCISTIILFIIGICGFFISDFPTWGVILISVIIIAITLALVIGVKAVGDNASKYDEKINEKLYLMKEIEKEIKVILDLTEDNEEKNIIKELYENVKYLDSTTSEKTKMLEEEILRLIKEISENRNNLKGYSKKINELLKKRNAIR